MFQLPLNFKKLDLTALLKEVAAKSVLWETSQIKRAITYRNNDKLMLRTDGINIMVSVGVLTMKKICSAVKINLKFEEK